MKVTFEDGGGAGPRRPADGAVRPIGRAVRRGLAGRCPRCGEGRMFEGFLGVRPVCRCCGEALHHHRADDLPPYLTILVVGHLVVSGLLVTERLYRPEIWVQMAIWLPMTLLLALALIRPIKGGVVGLQWALRLHGFGRAKPRNETSA